MVYKITGEQPFQVLSDSFSISPSEQNYTVQVSADGNNYSDLFAVSAGQTKMCTGMSNGSFYRLKNNQSEVSVNWRTTCKGGEGGGGGSYILPPATQQTLGGVKVGNGLTVQADGTLSANGGGSEAYRIELSTNEPDDFTEEDIDNLNDFFDAVKADPSIAKDAYLDLSGEFYRCSYDSYDEQIGDGSFTFVLVYSDWIDELQFTFLQEGFDAANHIEWNGGEGGDNTILKAVSGVPATLEKGDVYALNAPFEAPEAPDGQTVYGGNITDFMATVEDEAQIWVNKWDDAQHTETTNQGYFELDKNGDLTYYDYQGDKLFFAFDFPQGEWSYANGVWFRWEGENLYFCVDQESNGVYFNPDVDMNFDGVGSTLGVYQANFKTQPNVKIEVDEGTSVDGTLENPEQVVTNGSHHMYVSFNSPSAATGKVCELESYGDYFPLHYDYSNDRWTLYSTDGETALVEVSDGQNRSDDFGDGNVYLSYSGGVLNAYTDYDKGWKNWEMGDGGTVLDPEKLAKVSQLPADNRLVPVPQNYDYGRYLWTDGNNTSWNNAPSPEQYWGYPYDEGQAPVYSNWSVGWHRVVRSEDVLHIVKITVSDYETLVQNQQTDPNTLYLTYEPQV